MINTLLLEEQQRSCCIKKDLKKIVFLKEETQHLGGLQRGFIALRRGEEQKGGYERGTAKCRLVFFSEKERKKR